MSNGAVSLANVVLLHSTLVNVNGIVHIRNTECTNVQLYSFEDCNDEYGNMQWNGATCKCYGIAQCMMSSHHLQIYVKFASYTLLIHIVPNCTIYKNLIIRWQYGIAVHHLQMNL